MSIMAMSRSRASTTINSNTVLGILESRSVGNFFAGSLRILPGFRSMPCQLRLTRSARRTVNFSQARCIGVVTTDYMLWTRIRGFCEYIGFLYGRSTYVYVFELKGFTHPILIVITLSKPNLLNLSSAHQGISQADWISTSFGLTCWRFQLVPILSSAIHKQVVLV